MKRMKDISREERWAIGLTQAVRLGQQDALADAVAHTQSILGSIEEASAEEPDNQRVSRALARAKQQLETLTKELDDLRAEGIAKTEARRAGAPEEMQWKIPEL